MRREVGCNYSTEDVPSGLRQQNEALAKAAANNMELIRLMITEPKVVAEGMLDTLRATSNVALTLAQHVEALPDQHSADSERPPSLEHTTTLDASKCLKFLEIRQEDNVVDAWTDVTSDEDLVLHLLTLYFCWEYPTFAPFSKEHFMSDFETGTLRYCSPILVNALLALGCHFSTLPSTRANPDDAFTSGDHFFDESLRLLHLQDEHYSLTTIQALGIMSIREAKCGRHAKSCHYANQSVRLAIELGLHRVKGVDKDEVAVQAATFWGAFALEQ